MRVNDTFMVEKCHSKECRTETSNTEVTNICQNLLNKDRWWPLYNERRLNFTKRIAKITFRNIYTNKFQTLDLYRNCHGCSVVILFSVQLKFRLTFLHIDVTTSALRHYSYSHQFWIPKQLILNSLRKERYPGGKSPLFL